MKKQKQENKDLEDEILDEDVDLKDEDLEDVKSEGESLDDESEVVEDTDNAELDAALKKQEELTNRLQRLQADFSNYKKRVEKEKEGYIGFGIETLALQILPVIDNFDRALEAEEDKESPFYKGVEMIYSELINVLDKNNIHEMDSLEKPFNPELHHAVGMESTDKYDKDTVIRILQKGYIMKDKVIRPAMVIVSQ